MAEYCLFIRFCFIAWVFFLIDVRSSFSNTQRTILVLFALERPTLHRTNGKTIIEKRCLINKRAFDYDMIVVVVFLAFFRPICSGYARNNKDNAKFLTLRCSNDNTNGKQAATKEEPDKLLNNCSIVFFFRCKWKWLNILLSENRSFFLFCLG